MTPAPQAVIDELLPFRVLDVEWTDPTLRLMGSDWALNITCPWKFERAGVVEYEWTWAAVEDRVWDLVGYDIVAVLFDGGGDPHLEFSDGSILNVSSDIAYDTWVFRLPNNTFVGPLLDG